MTKLASAIATTITLAAAVLAADAPEPPRDLGLTEHASTRLAQIDVTVAGPKDAIHGLTAADFDVRLNDKLVHNVVVDDLCVTQPVAPAAAAPDTAVEASHSAPKTVTASYLLYFDMAHLTQSGRQGSIDSAREMLPKLLAGGQRAMIIANAAKLKTIVPFTSDLAQLDKALAALIPDLSTFDPYAAMEQNRLADIASKVGSTDPMSNDGPAAALALARRYAAEERWRQENDLRRLSMVLGRFADLDPPKVVLYFADTMRQNAGEHYLSFFNELNLVGRNGSAKPETEAIRIDAATGVLPLDRVINDAAGLGIRFYTVEGQGITGEASPIEARNSASSGAAGGNQAPPTVNSQHTRDAQDTLVSMAAETGGRAFLNGVAPGRMSAQILNDLSCLYLLSFDPKGFPQDNPLAVAVTVKRPKVTTTVRGRLVIQSDSVRTTGRVLSAFVSPAAGSQATDTRVRVGLIPISYESGKFKARAQVALAGSAVPATTWDIGASVVSRGAVRQDGSGRIQLMTPNTPVVYEQDMEFAPGDYDFVAVAHETQTDTVLSKETHGTWPKLDDALASVGPIAVTQRRTGGFLRNGEKQTQGAAVVAEDEPVQPDAPTAVIALVCRAKDQKRPLRVVRTLIGEAETPVGTTELELGSERCAQVVDLIPPKMLGAGRYRLVIVVSSDGKELVRVERAIVVPETRPVTAQPLPAGSPGAR